MTDRIVSKRSALVTVITGISSRFLCVIRDVRSVPFRDRAKWVGKVALAVVAMIAFGLAFSERFQIRFDPQVMSCIDAEFLLVDLKDKTPRTGEVFAYRAEHVEPVYRDGTEMAKYVAAGPGDRVEITRDFRLLVNGKERARGLPHLSGMPTEEVRSRFCGERVLKADEYWMLGTAFRSFDSRYFGPIRSSQIIGRAYVIF